MFLNTKEDWDNALNESKAQTIYSLIKTKNDILTNYVGGTDEQKCVGAHLLDGKGYYELQRRLNQFLIGEGAEGDGLIGAFLKADPKNYRDFVNNYGDGKHSEFTFSGNKEADVEKVYLASVALLLNKVWASCAPGKYEDKIRPTENASEPHQN